MHDIKLNSYGQRPLLARQLTQRNVASARRVCTYALFFHLFSDQGKGFLRFFHKRLHVRQKDQIKNK